MLLASQPVLCVFLLFGFRYTYGEVDIRRLPLARPARLHVVEGTTAHPVNASMIGVDDGGQGMGVCEVPLGSNFGQVRELFHGNEVVY